MTTKTKTKDTNKDTELVYSKSKYIRISPSKVRRVAKLVRGKTVNEAIQILSNLPHKGAFLLLKVINSARSNAVNNNKYKESELQLPLIMVNEGPMFKRFRPVGRGRIFSILKRTSHIIVGVNEKKGTNNGK